MNDQDAPRLTIGAVARLLGIGSHRVRQLDAELMPARDSSGRRLYTPAGVDSAAGARAVRRHFLRLRRRSSALVGGPDAR